MDNYSRRFQNARLSSTPPTSKFPNARCPPVKFPVVPQVPGTESPFLLSNTPNYQEIYPEPNRSQQQKPFRLWYSFFGSLQTFYECLLTCFTFIIKCLLPHPVTCHQTKQSEKPPDERVNCSCSSNNSQLTSEENTPEISPWLTSPAPLYSSDSEDDDGQQQSALLKRQFLENRENLTKEEWDKLNESLALAIDDDEIPVIRLIDNVIYFVHLYFTNYSAFVQELSQSFRNWGFPGDSPQRSAYRHTLNLKEKRPRIINKGIEYLKRRKVKEMTRVYGDLHKRWVLRISLASRLLIFFMQGLLVNLPQFFKHENDGFKFTRESTYGKLLDRLVESAFGGYINWDAHYFLHISVYGYTAEYILAFFPLLPMLLYFPSRIFYLLMGSVISLSSIVTVVGVVFNTWLFVKCTDNIYELAKFRVDATQQLITTACIMFCFNPASIFFSGLYTETLFAYLTSSVMLSLLRRQSGMALIFAALSCLCRSNGILNVGFILALDLQTKMQNWTRLQSRIQLGFRVIGLVIPLAIKLFFTLAPFLLYQMFAVIIFCDKGKVYDDPSEVPLYCLRDSLLDIRTLPYSYIQKKYWNVGFLEYFQVKQIPNFILAAPVLYILGTQSLTTFKQSMFNIIGSWNLCYIYSLFHGVHGLFLTAFCFCFVHVQVSTRMIMAACPYLYVYLATSHENEVEKFRNHEMSLPIQSLAITVWCIMYYLIGTIMFTLGLPWT